jgi:Protein of unknown function (DUF3253)
MADAAPPDDELIESVLLTLVRDRGPDASVCPSEVARALASDHWRPMMPDVRRIASRLAHQGTLEITQRGQPVPSGGPWKGPIRLRQPSLKKR